MDQIKKTLFQSRLAFVEDALHRLAIGSVDAEDATPGLLDTVRELVAMVTPEIQAPTVVSVGGVPIEEYAASGHAHTGNCRCRKTAAYDEDMLRELEVYLDNEMSLQAQRRTILKKVLKDGKYDVKEAAKAFEDWVEAGAKSYAKEFDEDIKKFPKDLIKDLAGKMALVHKKAVEDGVYDHLKSAADEQEPEQQAKEAAAPLKVSPDDLKALEKAAEKNGDRHYAGLLGALKSGNWGMADQHFQYIKHDRNLHDVPEDLVGELSRRNRHASDAAEELSLINEGIAHAVLAKIEKAHEAVTTSSSTFAPVANEDLSKISSSLASLLDATDLADPTVRATLLDLSKKADHVLTHFVR